MSISLDGFVATLDGQDGGLNDYFFSPSAETAKVITEGIQATGAIIMGRHTYDLGDQFDAFGDTLYRVPHLVLSHSIPAKLAKGTTQFIFVATGIERALQQAKAVAGGKAVVIGGGATTAQHFLRSGLIDEIHLHLVPKLLGQGMRLFDNINGTPIQLTPINVIAAPDVTHITWRVVR